MTFLIQHWLGVSGMPRRYGDYFANEGFTWMNQVSTVGSAFLAISMIPFLWNVYVTWRHAPLVTVDDPWGYGRSLEWATSCPPPRHNFTSLPRIRSESPAFDLHHPEVAALDHPELYPDLVGAAKGQVAGASDAHTAGKGDVK
jgi:cytochrome c oxidase subunit 1